MQTSLDKIRESLLTIHENVFELSNDISTTIEVLKPNGKIEFVFDATGKLCSLDYYTKG